MTSKRAYITMSTYSIGRPYQVCLLVIAVLAVYYPSMFAEISMLDDREAINGMLNVQTFDITSVFFPRTMEGGYYRPFIMLSYIIDRFWWFLDSKIMHFENILMHLFNTLMVFWIGIRLCRQQLDGKNMLPLFGAMLFALHPINTESINWISGRTDPMACTFVLAALLLVITYRAQRNVLFLIVAFVMTILGVFAKETALGFIPASIFLLMAEENSGDTTLNKVTTITPNSLILFVFYTAVAFLSALFFTNFYIVVIIGIVYWMHCLVTSNRAELKVNILKKFRTTLLIIAACSLLVLVFYGLRKAAYVSDMSKMSNTFTAMFADINYTIELFMGAAGFYVKKFFIPTPINIAIREIDPLYELFGVFCFMACIYLISLRRIAAALVIGGFMMLSPAFPFVFGTIAWTGYAERYGYIAAAFWILGCVTFVDGLSFEYKTLLRKYGLTAGITLLSVYAVITFQRNMLWQTNIAIFKDAVDKTPDFKNLRGIYISALVDKKEFEEAERQYFIAKKLHSITYDERYDLMYASLLMNKKKYDEAEGVFADIEKKTKGKSAELYEAMIAYYDSRLFSAVEPNNVKLLTQKKIQSFEKLYALNKSPYTSYRLGQAYIAVGNREKARHAIKTAAEQFENGESLKHNAEVLLKRIEMNVGQ
jgi:protein O-mannosyl-transferase